MHFGTLSNVIEFLFLKGHVIKSYSQLSAQSHAFKIIFSVFYMFLAMPMLFVPICYVVLKSHSNHI